MSETTQLAHLSPLHSPIVVARAPSVTLAACTGRTSSLCSLFIVFLRRMKDLLVLIKSSSFVEIKSTIIYHKFQVFAPVAFGMELDKRDVGAGISKEMDSILKATSSASGGDDGCRMPKAHEKADQGNHLKRKGRESSSVEGADQGNHLKKGPWTPAEDATLKEYIKKNGDRNWMAVEKYSGLSRCAKSCRFRWINHLRPNLKKGPITAEEEQLIVELHATMGNKWSQMAAKLPGRTDNEIKNFWNTRNKRRQRAGLTTYPEEVEMYGVPNDNQENLNPTAALTNEAGQHGSISQTGCNDIADVEFKRLRVELSIYDPSIRMPTVSDVLRMPMTVSDVLAEFDQNTSAIPAFDQYGTSDPRLLSRCDLIPNTSDQHANLNGNISASSDLIYGAFKELPSLQNFDVRHTPQSSLPPLESVEDAPESHQNIDGLDSVINFLNDSNNVDSFEENIIDDWLNEEVQSSTLNPSETQCDEQGTLRISLEPETLRSSLEPEAPMETTKDDDDKHGAEFPGPENQNPSPDDDIWCDVDLLLSSTENDSPSPETQNLIQLLLVPDSAPDLSFMEKDSPSPKNQKVNGES